MFEITKINSFLERHQGSKILGNPPCERPSAIEQPLKMDGTQNANCQSEGSKWVQQLFRSWQCEKLGAVPI